jgi:hypothetical protein
MNTSIVLAVLGTVIIIALAFYAFRLLTLVKSQKSEQQAVRDKRIASMQSSIQTIAFAMHQQQCDLSEGVIRICRLLEAMPVDPHPDYAKEFPYTHELFEKVKSYPTHEARTLLTKSVRKQNFDRNRSPEKT